ncbi:CbbQ/NirQ/NorQ/GpvN family protein [Leptospira gomenensis]|uniref:CbbQ/NirQ/NorQ/GpvN family protein n=1 Tax=Leptospira gomenensis TaxID=2484974 RepID=A0A5F1YS01_9LEPT|nr:CbbQ/NirQ/NorQ/GpvN family protein [Leptospira gomenensis]TGK33243.1 CbbQ/NirQ/NorQ/GpvN family protein [Leptospira gomenensis]TGK35525.1 CbbQ/NirQ/NorQ/GpvN family protein [Leptospira gomenensis]TGK40848.1 CbbQ/NirQ/NorQ/GpvN family protein [Leptospira gomenensis]TGK61139.1 CbbQ/NirQ/NorQ/GpvN family protein [Leptospira gomenensis]
MKNSPNNEDTIQLFEAVELPFYKETGHEVVTFEHAHKNKLPLLIKGPTGSGKSRFVEYMAARMKLPLLIVSCHEETSAVDLLGRYLIQGTETVWQDGPLTRSIRMGAILYVDEIAEARPDTIVAIHPLTDYRREIYLDRRNESIKAPDSFMLVASYNPGYQKGWKELKPSTRQRFVSLQFDYPKSDVEETIVKGETGISSELAGKLVRLGQKIRNLTELGLTETCSTRLLVDAGKMIASGLPARLSCEVAIVQPLSDDRDIVNGLKDLVSLLM